MPWQDVADFFSREEGQKRRQWLNDRMGRVAEVADYYLGPTGLPDRMGALAQVGGAINPVNDVTDSMAAAGRGDWGDAALSGAIAVAPAVPAAYAMKVGAQPMASAAAGVEDVLTGFAYSPGLNAAGDVGQRFLADEDGAIRAWHGSPHDFDRFSLDKIGTGEGAQAYGHGLYFAETPEVAKSYQMMGANVTVRPEPDGRLSVIAGPRGGAQEVIGTYDNADDAFRVMKEQQKSYGRLYEVSIDANPEDFLDWDAPLGGQEGKPREALDDFFRWYAGEDGMREIYDSGVDLKDVQQQFDDLSPQQFASAMKARGVPGSRYRDAGSRGRPGGLGNDETRNYVVFDDKLISILNKYGLAGILGLSGAQMEQMQNEGGGI